MKKPTIFLSVIFSLLLLVTNVFAANPNQGLYIKHQLDMARALQNSSTENTAILARVNAPTGGSISGALYGLVDADGTFKSAAVEAFTDGDPATGDSIGFKTITYVNPDGTYQLTDLPAGDYIVFAMADGYISKYYDNTTDYSLAKRITVAENEQIRGIDFRMEKIPTGSGSISGVVTKEGGNEPLGGANVNVFSTDGYYYYGWAAANRDGSFVVTGLVAGNYYATAWADGFITEYYNNAEDFADADMIAVADNQETTGINFTLAKGAVISGRVLDKSGQPLFGVYVEAMTAFADSTIIGRDGNTGKGYYGYGSTMTDERGNYAITGLPGGTFYVHATYWDAWKYGFMVEKWYNNVDTFADATPLEVTAGQDITGIDFTLAFEVPNGAIAGQVTDVDGNPVANATVQATTFLPEGMMRPSFYGSAVTDRAGNYVIPNLPDDQYIVSVWSQVGWQYVYLFWPGTEKYEEAEPVVVAGAPTTGIDFKLPTSVGSASISGTVTNVDGKPLPWAYVQISPAELNTDNGNVKAEVWAYASADSNGAYKVEQLPAGKYVVYASYWQELNFGQEWYDDAETRETATVIDLANREQRIGVDFSLNVKPIYGGVTGLVRDAATGAPISRAYVELQPFYRDYNPADRLCAPFWYNNFYAVTDENGAFAFDMVYEGQYLVAAYANGAFAYYKNAVVVEMATPIDVIGGQKTQVDFDLTVRQDGTGKITGLVSDDYGNPFDIAIVTARPAMSVQSYPESEMFYTAVVNKDGSYELTGLPVADYYVMSFGPYAVAEFYDNVYDPAEAKMVRVDDGQTVNGINFNLSQIWVYDSGMEGGWKNGNNGGARVIGTVTNADGSALAGAGVYVMNESGQRLGFSRTSNNGAYEIAGMPPGSYVMQAGKIGYEGAYNGNVADFAAAQAIQFGNGTTQVDFVLTTLQTDVDDDVSLPATVELLGNYPNPFNPSTEILFELPADKQVTIRIYSVTGAFVAQVANSSFSGGRHSVTWNGVNTIGQQVSSGLYFYEFRAGDVLKTGKMILMR